MIENKPRRLKIMWVSNDIHVPTGYGNATLDMHENFKQAGWTPDNLAFTATAGLTSGRLKDLDGYWHFPLMDHLMGSDAQRVHSVKWGSDVVVGLYDIWPHNPADLQQMNRWIPWVPEDYDPVPPPIVQNLRFANRIITMSKFGQKQLQEKGFASTFIPHGVNTNIFKPMDQKKIREELHINPNVYIFGMVSENKSAVNPRKSYQQVLEAFAMYLKKKPNSYLYIHTDPEFPGGFQLKPFCDYLGISQHIGFPDRYQLKYITNKHDMAKLYNIFDCLLNPSATEGFGIPIIEAMACGKPVIVQDWTAMSELVQDGVTGYKVPAYFPIWYPIGSYVCYPNSKDIYERMMQVSNFTANKWETPCRNFAVKNYDQDMLFESRWLPFFQMLEDEIYPSQLTTTK